MVVCASAELVLRADLIFWIVIAIKVFRCTRCQSSVFKKQRFTNRFRPLPRCPILRRSPDLRHKSPIILLYRHQSL